MQGKMDYEPKFYAAISKDRENVRKSSSGGIFTELCKTFIEQGGKVYGAIWDGPLHVSHVGASDMSGANLFRKSKYIKSDVWTCYPQVKEDLEKGRKVLFSGVGCQISGLLKYLGREYDNLYICDLLCHGMMKKVALEKYYEELRLLTGEEICKIDFRDKRAGWENNMYSERFISGKELVTPCREHPIHNLYLKGINVEKKCAFCKFQSLPRISDISLADFWKYEGKLRNVDNDWNDGGGISMIIVHSSKGQELFNAVRDSMYIDISDKESAMKSCIHVEKARALHPSQKAFEALLKTYGFHQIYGLFSEFGEIVLAEDCHVLLHPEEEDIIQIFREDTQEIVYLKEEDDVLTGIVTYGQFLEKYAQNQAWANENFKRVVFSQNSVKEMKEIFEENTKVNRIPVVGEKGELLFEVRRKTGANGKNDKRKVFLPFSILRHRGIPCMFVNRPDKLDGFRYSEAQEQRMREKLSFPLMSEEVEQYEAHWREIYGVKYTKEYIGALGQIPPIIPLGKKYVHADAQSAYVNVIGGKRITVGLPLKYNKTIHIYGRCGAFGYAVEDGETIASRLQEYINRESCSPVGVITHGLWGADENKIVQNLTEDVLSREISENDIVLLYMDSAWMNRLLDYGVEILETTEPYHDNLKKKGTFFEIPGHMNAEGYDFVARFIYQYMAEKGYFNDAGNIVAVKKERQKAKYEQIPEELAEYLVQVKQTIGYDGFSDKKIGAIVMNCNPFTKGHRYLIETASRNVDILLVFVLEEDKSFFSFKDRYAMVQKGTEDLKNVYVCPSGRYMISSITFPQYFLKEQQSNVTINPAGDVELFAKYIAPALNISVRFVGTEPFDNITYQYNQAMKRILPRYGVQLCEVERLCIDSTVVSATAVRKAIGEKDDKCLMRLLPQSTFEYLKSEAII